MEFKLTVTWPDEVYTGCNKVGKNETTDTYDSLEQAEIVARMLQTQGFGGEGKFFPIDTKVEELYTKSEIETYRQKMIDQLKSPEAEKTKGLLEEPDNPNARCCLGHGCHALGIKRAIHDDSPSIVYYGGQDMVAPAELINKIGLFSNSGDFSLKTKFNFAEFKSIEFDSLVNANDSTDLTTQDIGEYLQSVIEGGENTPWRSLSEYPEKL